MHFIAGGSASLHPQVPDLIPTAKPGSEQEFEQTVLFVSLLYQTTASSKLQCRKNFRTRDVVLVFISSAQGAVSQFQNIKTMPHRAFFLHNVSDICNKGLWRKPDKKNSDATLLLNESPKYSSGHMKRPQCCQPNVASQMLPAKCCQPNVAGQILPSKCCQPNVAAKCCRQILPAKALKPQ